MNAVQDSPTVSDLHGKKRPVIAITVAFICLICMSLLAVQGWSVYEARRTQLRSTKVAADNMARALADHGDSTIELVDMILSGVVESVQHDGIGGYGERLHLQLIERVKQTPSLQGLSLYDASGNGVLNSVPTPPAIINNADREFFIYHRDHKDLLAHLGTPIRSRANQWVLPVSRRLEAPDGSFAGVALATVQLGFFRSFYESFDIGSRGAIVLALDNGTMVMRHPYQEALLATDVGAEQVFRRRPGKDMLEPWSSNTAERLFSYRHLRRYPLMVAVNLSKEEILTSWWASAYLSTAGVAVLALILLWMGVRLFRQVTIRDRLEDELRNAQLALVTKNRSLKLMARNDGLTGIANRRHFDARLAAEFSRAAREGSTLALVLIDVDNFKKYNDRYGHPAGDAALQFVGQCIRAGRRRTGNLAARVGGEEFAILLPNTDLYGAIAVAEAVRKSIAAAGREHLENPSHIVTVSCGVHALVPGHGKSSTTLVEAADRALYLAKSKGRNRVCPDAVEVALRSHRLPVPTND